MNAHEITTIKCGNCGRLRQETNHWFVVRVERGTFRCVLLAAMTMTAAKKLKSNDWPACGQQCAQKLFEQYMAQTATRGY